MASRVDSSSEVQLARAWPRFWARLLDIQLYSFPIGFLILTLFPDLLASDAYSGRSGDLFIGFISLPFVMLLDAAILSMTGTSPGKALAALTLVTEDGELVSISKSISRNLKVYLQGLVLGIPIFALFGYISGYNSVSDKGITSWDSETQTRVVSRDETGNRTWLVGILAVAVYFISTALARAGEVSY